jgi:Predicted membrane protein (DUF2254)
MESHRRFRLGLLAFLFMAAVLFAVEFLVEWVRLGMPALLGWADTNNAKLVDVLSPMARAYNNILAMLLATIGLAIPLTANMHTPKLIDMFLRDRVNQIMLGFCALGAANFLFVDSLIGPNFAPMWAYRLAIAGALIGWVVIVPYFFYVVRFLDPSNILARLKDQITWSVERAAHGHGNPATAHDFISERLHQIGTLVLKSIDRADRGVALEGIWSLKRILDHYGTLKPQLPDWWFHVNRKDFIGMSAEALEIVNDDRTWFEHRAMMQVFLAYQNALAKTQDVISALSDAARIIATNAANRGDAQALHLAIRFFNNYLREAIKRKDLHATYDLFYQYRLLAGDLLEHPELLKQIAQYFRYYCEQAAAAGLEFVGHIVGFDLMWIVRQAYEKHSAAAPELLENLLELNHHADNDRRRLLVKAKVILGGYFVQNGLATEAGRIKENLRGVPLAVLATIEHDLLTLTERSFWEVTDRQVNFEWIAPECRDAVRSFIDSLKRIAPVE